LFLLQGSFAKDPYNFIDPTNQSHPLLLLSCSDNGTDAIDQGHCSMLQCVAACCSMLQYDAVCCSVMQCVVDAIDDMTVDTVAECVAVCCSVLWCDVEWCSVL